MGRLALTVVVPCLNEADNVSTAYQEIVAELDRYDDLEVLFIDDGSTDDTLTKLRGLAAGDQRVSYLSFTRNFGLEAAFSAGFRYARHPWVLQLDADLQFPPAEAHKLVKLAEEGYDAVFGVRVDRQDPWLRRAGSALHELLARRILGIELPRGGTSFRLVRTVLARRVVDLRLGTPYFLATLPRLTRNWTTVPVAHQPRLRGAPKVTVRGLARHAVDLFMSYSVRTITLAASGGLAAAAIAVLAATAALIPGAERFAAAAAALALAVGLVALAVATRYLLHLGRGQTTQIPPYLIREASVEVAAEERL